MKHTYQYLSFICIATGIIFSLSSCYVGSGISDPYIVNESRQKENFYYLPSAPNTPFQSRKNDMNFSLLRIADTKYGGCDVQASYMPGKHIGIIAGYSFANSNGASNDYMKYNRFELGSGFATALSKNWHFETYAGFGSGKITNYHSTGYSNVSLTHYFIQPAVAVHDAKKNVQIGLVSKFTGVNFNVTDTSFKNDREPFSTSQVKSLYAQPFHIMWEPGFVFRAGWKNFQFHTGYSFSADLTNPGLHRANGNFSLGISLRVNTEEVK